MTNTSGTNGQPLGREADNPRETYQSPANVLTDEKLSRKQKITLLESWKIDITARLEAEAEGMGQTELMSVKKGANLADEHRLLDKALSELEE